MLKGSELAQVFAALRANDLIWPYVVNGYLKGKPPPAFDLLYWNSDGTNLPGPMFCWYLRNTYLENKLREPGGTTAARRAGGPGDASTCRRSSTPPRKTTSCRGRPPTRARSCCRRRRRLRARRERAHRRGDQPAREEQAQLLDGAPMAAATPTRSAGSRPRRRSPAAGGPPGTRGWRRTAAPRSTPRKTPGNAEFTADRARPGQLREGEGRVAPGTAGSTPQG